MNLSNLMLVCVACFLQFFQKSSTMNLSNLVLVCVACFLQLFQKSHTTNVSNHLICLFCVSDSSAEFLLQEYGGCCCSMRLLGMQYSHTGARAS
jgi:hypothetical protein